MSEMVAKYSEERLSHFEYPGLLDAPAMCTATVDLAANWTRSIVVPFLLQVYLPPSGAPTVFTASWWEGAEREGIKSQPAFALHWWQMRSWLVLSRLVLEGGKAGTV